MSAESAPAGSHGSAPRDDLRRRLGGVADRPLAEAIDLIQADQARRWRGGERVPAEDYLAMHRGLSESAEAGDRRHLRGVSPAAGAGGIARRRGIPRSVPGVRRSPEGPVRAGGGPRSAGPDPRRRRPAIAGRVGPPRPDRPPAGDRRLRGPRRAGPGGDGGRLPGSGPPARSPGRPEADRPDRRRPACRGRPVRHRGAGGGADPPPQYRADLRGRRAGGAALPGDGVRRGGQPPLARRHAEAAARGRPAGGGGRPGGVRGAPAGRRPPGPQAGQHPAGRRRHAQGRRFRPGQAGRRRLGDDPDRLAARLPLVHGPRAGRARPRTDRPGRRRPRPRGDPLRADDRPPSLPRRDDHPDARAGPEHRPGPADPARPGPAARPGDDLPEVPGEGAAAALRRGLGPGRRPPALPRRPADPGPPYPGLGPGLEMGPPPTGAGRPGGDRPAPGRRPGRRHDRRRLDDQPRAGISSGGRSTRPA